MATEMITLKMDGKFLKEIDSVVKKEGYQSRTEFIRGALREKVESVRIKEAMMQLGQLRGKSKKKTTEAEYERIREETFEKLYREKIKSSGL